MGVCACTSNDLSQGENMEKTKSTNSVHGKRKTSQYTNNNNNSKSKHIDLKNTFNAGTGSRPSHDIYSIDDISIAAGVGIQKISKRDSMLMEAEIELLNGNLSTSKILDLCKPPSKHNMMDDSSASTSTVMDDINMRQLYKYKSSSSTISNLLHFTANVSKPYKHEKQIIIKISEKRTRISSVSTTETELGDTTADVKRENNSFSQQYSSLSNFSSDMDPEPHDEIYHKNTLQMPANTGMSSSSLFRLTSPSFPTLPENKDTDHISYDPTKSTLIMDDSGGDIQSPIKTYSFMMDDEHNINVDTIYHRDQNLSITDNMAGTMDSSLSNTPDSKFKSRNKIDNFDVHVY